MLKLLPTNVQVERMHDLERKVGWHSKRKGNLAVGFVMRIERCSVKNFEQEKAEVDSAIQVHAAIRCHISRLMTGQSKSEKNTVEDSQL